jgi:2-polyprenyl-3-methyl-5-hydroxy-6-metoxy-1,4-benzoquinol methylase
MANAAVDEVWTKRERKRVRKEKTRNMLGKLKTRIRGLTYLFSHPSQLRWVIIRETRFGNRNRTKRDWVEWQKYDANMHIAMMQAHPEAQVSSSLNQARINILSEMIKSIGDDLNVLDVGCGDGVISEPIVKMGNHVTSVELPTIAALAQKCRVPGIVAGDAEELAFVSETFDLILASEVVEHLWNPASFFDEAYRVLKPKGYLIVETPEGKGSLYYDSHKHFFTVELIQKTVGSRFTFCDLKRLEPTTGAQTPTIIVLLRKS